MNLSEVSARWQIGRRARAYCGDAHGSSWVIAAEADPPDTVHVPARGGRIPYRLAHSPRTGRPLKDSQGNYLYLPDPGDVQVSVGSGDQWPPAESATRLGRSGPDR